MRSPDRPAAESCVEPQHISAIEARVDPEPATTCTNRPRGHPTNAVDAFDSMWAAIQAYAVAPQLERGESLMRAMDALAVPGAFETWASLEQAWQQGVFLVPRFGSE